MNNNINRITKKHDNIIDSLNSREPLDIVAPKVEDFIKQAKFFSKDTAVENLIVDLETALTAHSYDDLSKKVHEVFCSMKLSNKAASAKEARSITLLDKAISQYENAMRQPWSYPENFGNVFSSKGRNALLALKSIQNCENNIEIRCKIIELKVLIERDLYYFSATAHFFSKVKNVAYQIFQPIHWRSSNERILELLKADPKRFGLTKDQLFETAQMIIEKYPEKIDFLINNREIGKIFDWRPVLYFKKPKEVGLDPYGFKERSVKTFTVFIGEHGLQYLKDHLEENMNLFGKNVSPEQARKWLIENVETFGLEKKRRFEILKRLAEKDPEASMKMLYAYQMESTRIRGDWGEDYQGTFGAMTSDELLEISRVIEGPAIRGLARFFSMLTKPHGWEFMKLAMEKDSTGFNPNDIVFYPTDSYRYSMLKLTKDETQEQRLELLAIGIVHQSDAMSNMDCSSFFIENKDKVLERNPGMLLFLEPEKAIEKGIPGLGHPLLDEMAQEACKKNDPERTTLLKWIGYTDVCRKFYGSHEIERRGSEILNKILGLRFPALRHKMTKLLFQELDSTSSRTCLESESLKKLFSGKYSSLFQLLLTPLLSEESNVSDLLPIISLLNSSYYEDAGRRNIAASALMTLENSSLTKEEKLRTLKILFPLEAAKQLQKEALELESNKAGKKEKQGKLEDQNARRKNLCLAADKNLQLMEAFIHLHWVDRLKEVQKPEDLEPIFQNRFGAVTGVGEVKKIGEKYLKTFAVARNPFAIFIYAGKLRSIASSTEKAVFLKAFKGYVESVLNGTFPLTRYEEVPGDHLFTVFHGRPGLKALWMKGESKKLSEFTPSGKKGSVTEYVHTYLHQRICLDNHVSEEEFPFLVKCLKDSTKVAEMLVAIDREIATPKKDSEHNKLLLEKKLLLLLSGNTTDFLTEKGLIDAVFPNPAQFKQDLHDLKIALSEKKLKKEVSLENYTVADTDSWEDLLLCGTEIPGSCQSIHAGINTNKCLLGYILDGKNRLVVVKKEDGTIVARAVMRILLDKTNMTPVLFKERVYAEPGLDVKVTEALDQMFEERAKALGIPLATSSTKKVLCSLNSRAPYEYVDEQRLGETDGKWEVGG